MSAWLNHQIGNASVPDVLASLPHSKLAMLGVDITEYEASILPIERRRTATDGHPVPPFDAIGRPGKCPRTTPASDSHLLKVLRAG